MPKVGDDLLPEGKLLNNKDNIVDQLYPRKEGETVADAQIRYEKEQLKNMGLSNNVLIEANKIIHGRAQDDYGNVKRSHTNIARQWTKYLYMKYGSNSAIDAEDVCYMMMLVKMIRDIHKPKRDNLVDACGYIALIQEIRDDADTVDPSFKNTRKDN